MHHGRELPLRAAGAQEGRNRMVSPLLRITPLPSGRAARVKVSDASRLPPNCHCGRQGTGCYPRRVRLHGTRPGRRLHANSKHKPYIASTSASQVRRKTEPLRRYRKSNFSTECGQNLFAVAGIREPPPAGVTRKRGQGPLLPARRAQRHYLAARRRRNPQPVKHGHIPHPLMQWVYFAKKR